MMTASSPVLLLVCGLPGSGKTTLARRLAVERRAVRLCPDEWLAALGLDLFDEAARNRLEGILWQLARDLLVLGQSVVLESGFWGRSDRDEKRVGARASGVAVELHLLNPPLDELWRRLRRRNERLTAVGEGDAPGIAPVTRQQLEEWSTWFERPDETELRLFDG